MTLLLLYDTPLVRSLDLFQCPKSLKVYAKYNIGMIYHAGVLSCHLCTYYVATNVEGSAAAALALEKAAPSNVVVGMIPADKSKKVN